jgi:hypothetical protein
METLQEVQTMFTAMAEWKAQKLGKFSSSEIHRLLKSGRTKGQLFGDGAMTYINKKIAEIITGESNADISTLKALEWGAANEFDAILTYEQLTGRKVEYYGVATPKFFPYNAVSGCSPDGVCEDDVIEVKCPYVTSNHIEFLLASKQGAGSLFETAWLKANKPEYFSQVQFNMMSLKKNRGIFLSYDPRVINHNHRLAMLTIHPDDEIQKDIAHRIDEASAIVINALNTLG